LLSNAQEIQKFSSKTDRYFTLDLLSLISKVTILSRKKEKINQRKNNLGKILDIPKGV